MDGFTLHLVWSTLTNLEFNEHWHLPTLSQFKLLARMMQRTVIKIIEPTVERNYYTELAIWIFFHLLRRERIILRSIIVGEFLSIHGNKFHSIRNPGWISRVMEYICFDFSHVVWDNVKGVVVNKVMVQIFWYETSGLGTSEKRTWWGWWICSTKSE